MVTLNENLPIISLNKIRKLTGERVLFYLITEKLYKHIFISKNKTNFNGSTK